MEFNDRIVTSLTIFARNCDVRKIDRKTAAEFLDRHHIYGSASCRYCYGLYQRRTTGSAETKLTASGEPALVAVATFSNARRWTKGNKVISSYEWVRYASLEDSRVVGGMGKLLKAFIQDRHPDDIMTYAISSEAPDRPRRDGLPMTEPGNVYRKLGFAEEDRKFFPSRIDDSLSVSIKYRLKLTDWKED
ncbi:MAG: hypothetical protein SPE21_01045 [Candidatus Cryptobacteroides sp.]|nr:hypothetical protein [Candidatus Cryptobacteroides sp.]